MSNLTIIVKNNTGSEISIGDLGKSIPAYSQIILSDYYNISQITGSDILRNYVAAGTLVINNGISDLSIAQGVDWITLETVASNIVTPPSGSTPPSSPSSGTMWYNPSDSKMYSYDLTRGKWLSTDSYQLYFCKDGDADGIYLKIMTVSNSNAAYRIISKSTIIAVSCDSKYDSYPYKTFHIMVNDFPVDSFSYINTTYYTSKTKNVDVEAGDRIKLWVDPSGTNVKETVCYLILAWRY